MSAAASSARPRIISRRALEHHLPRNPSLVRPPPPRTAKKVDDTPWPLPMRIAGYVALGLTVPYTAATLIAGSEKLRDSLEGDRPDLDEDRKWGKAVVGIVRKYWGKDEGMSYVAWLREQKRLALQEWSKAGGSDSSDDDSQAAEGAKAKEEEEEEPVYKSFESEMPHLSHAVRAAQIEIERLRHSPVLARITLNPEGEMGGCAERTLQGDVPADAGILRGIMADAGVAGGVEGNAPVAVDFVDEEEPPSAAALTTTEEFQTSDALVVGGEFAGEAGDEHPAAKALRQLTYSFSAWHYDPTWETSSSSSSSPPASKSSQAASASNASNSAPAPASSTDSAFDQLRLKELDQKAKQLASDLRDPACTRDLDDVREELRQVKAEARKLRGWGGTVRGWFGGS